MELCSRCQVKIADFKCEDCNKSFCVGCDSYLHSLAIFLGHKRILIQNNKIEPYCQNSNFNTINTNDKTIENNNINEKDLKKEKNNINNENNCPEINGVSKNLIIQLRENYEKEKEDLQKKIKELTEELNNTKQLLNKRNINLNDDNNNINNYENNNYNNFDNNNQIQNDNFDNIEKLKTIISDKDIQIEYLIEQLNNQKEINCQLNKKIKNYESCVCLTNDECCNKINNLNCLIDNLCIEKKSIEECYKNKIEDIYQMHECEKQQLICDYECQINQLHNCLINERNKYICIITDNEKKYKEYEEKTIKETNQLNNIIENLKELNSENQKEQNELINMNDTLKKTLEDVNIELEKNRNEYTDINNENEKLIEINNQIIKENEEIKKANSQLQGLVYGRFGKNKN